MSFFVPRLKIQPKTQDWADVALVTDEKIIKRVDRLLVRPICRVGYWSLFYNLLPLAGGTAQAHATSLTHPGSRNIVWNGAITHNAAGSKGDGVTGWALVPPIANTVDANDVSVGAYCQTAYNDLTTSDEAIMGVIASGNTGRITLSHKISEYPTWTTAIIGTSAGSTATGGVLASSSTNDVRGFIQSSSHSPYCFKNGAAFGAPSGSVSATSLGGTNFVCFAINWGGNVVYHYSGIISLIMVASSVNLTQHQTLYSIVQQYQIAMGRAYVA